MYYTITHVPHAMSVVPLEMRMTLTYSEIERSLAEGVRVTDWHTEKMITEADQQLVFPYSRVFCDVERYEADPLELVGQGVYYTKTIDGKHLRDPNPKAEKIARRLYTDWHKALERAVYDAISIDRVVLIDMHSYSDFQADQTGSGARPDICLGFDRSRVSQPPVEGLQRMFERHGYSVAQNQPYEGAIAPPHVSSPDLTCIMFEVHKRLYLDPEGNTEPRGFGRLQLALNEAVHLLKVVS